MSMYHGDYDQTAIDQYNRNVTWEDRFLRWMERREYMEPAPPPSFAPTLTRAQYECDLHWEMREDGPGPGVSTAYDPARGRRVPMQDTCWVCDAPWDHFAGCGRCGQKP